MGGPGDDDRRFPGAQALAKVLGHRLGEEARLLVEVYEVLHRLLL